MIGRWIKQSGGRSMAVSPSPCEGHSASRVEITMNKALLERAASDLNTRTEQERCPRCVLLPSPELLSRGSSSGSDNTNTLNDFYSVFGIRSFRPLVISPLVISPPVKSGILSKTDN